VIYRTLERLLPAALRRYLLFFEAEIERAVGEFAKSLPAGSRVLDAGAGECRHAGHFTAHRYTAVDLGIGDAAWNYRALDAVADLTALPFRDASFDACINIVTLEHVREPAAALAEMARVLEPGGRLLLIVPLEWEVHQAPHDYFRYTRYGVAWLLERAGFDATDIRPVGGWFRLISRRLLNGLQFFPGPLIVVAAIFLAPLALMLPLLDSLDRERNFTLGYVCIAGRTHGASRVPPNER
jgi:SAM-dependent methyltransferase